MRKGIIGALFVVAVVVLVIVLRNGLPKPQQAAPGPEQVSRTVVSGLAWRQVALPDGTDQAHRSAADLSHAVFPVRGADGERQLLSRSSDAVTEVAHGPDPLVGTLDGSRLVVDSEIAGRTTVSTVDLGRGVRTARAGGFEAGGVAVAAGVVAVQEGDSCLTFLDVASLNPRSRHCSAPGWAISLLTAETDSVQWKETGQGDCGVWYRLDDKDQPQRMPTGGRACRAASVIEFGGWEVTTDYPAYDLGILYPGPLVAWRDGREIALDSTVLDVHACGKHVYWLSKPVGRDQTGELVRWTPGEARIEALTVGEPGTTSPARCVNGVLNVVVYGSTPHLWILPDP
ncbi:hypothetical protein [Actinocrispum sp. NPDC049592]|uniref:hypothetical protein n=1 Tax=Actinocrispum sp. NPDC049592 TaxID=3154835 RepID=UPI003434DAE3